MRFFLPLSVVALWSAQSNDAFQLPATIAVNKLSPNTITAGRTAIFANSLDHENENSDTPPRGEKRQKIAHKVKKSLAFLTPIAIAGSSVGALVGSPQTAHAGAPVMAMPKTKAQDPVQVAFDLQEKKLMIEAQKELSEFQATARARERESGPAARDQFEKEYKESQAKKAEAQKEGLDQLKRDLLDEGIDPALDVEGQRQLILYTRGVDLGEIAGTKFNVEKRYLEKGSKDAFAIKKNANREMIKAMVQDLKNRGMDPLMYFSTHQDKTEMILNLPAEKAAALAAKYSENLELYGQIAVPKEGEKSAKELMAQKVTTEREGSKEEEKRLKAEAKAKAAAEKAAAKAEKVRLKEEKRAAKEAAKIEKEAAKAAAAAAAISAAAAASPSTPSVETSLAITPDEDSAVAIIDEIADEGTDESAVTSDDEEESSTGGIKIVPAAAIVVSVGGGAYAFKMVRDRASAAEEERQRQFKILMGGETVTSSDTEPAAGETMTDFFDDETDMDEQPEPVVETPLPKKKKRRGLKSVFGNKSNGRETNIEILVAPDSTAAEFSKTLAKILTFGAPGRFPDVTNLPGPMPMETYELESARDILTEAQSVAGITKEESAEIFANVVNCMLIDIVDLASTSIKEKDQKVTTDAIGIVITFMDLAASLYTSIADGVDIKPVTYGGDIGKNKLEQMYSTYAMSGMTNMENIDEKFDDRVSLLQDVFQINPKKAEGLMLKAMQKNMMEMMKTGEMPEGMEEMMNSMGGLDGMGMPGMGDGEEPDPEQLKEMLRTLKGLKDSGSLPESELAEVRNQFKEAFGSSIDEIMKGADEAGNELGEQDKELLDLMKDILG